MDDNQNQAGNTEPVTATPITSQTTTNEPTGAFTFNETTIMASLSYLGPLVLVPFLTKKDNPFVSFHVKQGLLVFGLEIIVWFLGGPLLFLAAILNLVTLVFSIIGIINALKQTQKELPFIGKYASHINI